MNKFFPFWGFASGQESLLQARWPQNRRCAKTGISAHLAQDASKNTKKKFTNSAVYYELPLAEIGTKEELGRAIGAEMRSIIAITEKGFAKN